MSGWVQVKLGEISTNIQTGPFGSQLHQSDYEADGVPVIMPKDIVNGAISETSIARIGEQMAKKLSRHKVVLDDIVYPRRGDVAKCAIIGEKQSGWLCGTGCLKVTIDKAKALPLFVYYQLQTPSKTGWIEKHTVGATMPNLNTGIIGQVPIDLPTLNSQCKITDILFTYDNLIDNYRRQIKLSEEAVQRLYKEWFVDLRFPGYEYTKILDGVPEGWEKTDINSIMTFHRGYDLTKSNMQYGKYPVVGSTSVIGYHNKYKIHGPGIVTGRSGSLGKYQLIWEDFWPHNTSLYVSDMKEHHFLYLYGILQTVDFSVLNNGGAIPTLNRNTLSAIKVLKAPKSLQEKYVGTVEPYYNIIRDVEKEITLLTEARDRLLPKLMSGEIKV